LFDHAQGENLKASFLEARCRRNPNDGFVAIIQNTLGMGREVIMNTRRDKEAEEVLNRIRAGQRPSTMASFVGKLIFFPRGPISRAVGTLLS
jgi:hypothetical protein